MTLGEDGVTIDDIVVHDETNKVLAQMLAGLKLPEFPEPIGVLYCESTAPSYTLMMSISSVSLFARQKVLRTLMTCFAADIPGPLADL